MKKGRKRRLCPLHICSSQKTTSPKNLLTPDYLDIEGLKETSSPLKCDKYSLLGSLFLLPCNTGSPLKLARSSSARAELLQMFPVLHLLAGHLVTLTQLCFFTNAVNKFWVHFSSLHKHSWTKYAKTLVTLLLFQDSESTYSITMNKKWNIWDGTGVDIAYFKILYWHILQDIGETMEPQSISPLRFKPQTFWMHVARPMTVLLGHGAGGWI
jgi:hypothetical protein